MNIDTFLKKIVEIFDDLPSQEISITSNFRDIDGWSSMTALSLMAMIDEEYDVVIKGDDIRNAVTIGDIFSIVKSRK